MKAACFACGGYYDVWLGDRMLAACSSAEGGCGCASLHRGYDVLYVPADFETVVKGGSTYESDALARPLYSVLKDLKKGYAAAEGACPVAEFEDPYIKSRLEVRSGQIYEAAPGNLLRGIPDAYIHISRSSSAAARLLVLEELARRGLLSRFDYVVLDRPDAGLRPVHVARLAAWMRALASCGIGVVAAAASAGRTNYPGPPQPPCGSP